MDDLEDPCPNIHDLFVYYNDLYFQGKLGRCSVDWSSRRMTLCAGICSFSPLGGCEIRLSEPLLKFRPVSDLKNTLLHEMIHAYLFLTNGNKDRDDHGPRFQYYMNLINQHNLPDEQRPIKGYEISIYHQFKDEVDVYRVHHWKCSACGDFIKRSMNRTPSLADCFTRQQHCSHPNCRWHMHQKTCSGIYEKIHEPADYVDKRKQSRKKGAEEDGKEGVSLSRSSQKRKSHEKDVGPKKAFKVSTQVKSASIEKFFSTVVEKDDEKNLPNDDTAAEQARHENAGPGDGDDQFSDLKEISLTKGKHLTIPSTPGREKGLKLTPVRVKPVTREDRDKGVRQKKINGAGTSDLHQTNQCPCVIIMWANWYSYASDEEEEPLVNKRTERRKQERMSEFLQTGNGIPSGLVERTLARESELLKTVEEKCVDQNIAGGNQAYEHHFTLEDNGKDALDKETAKKREAFLKFVHHHQENEENVAMKETMTGISVVQDLADVEGKDVETEVLQRSQAVQNLAIFEENREQNLHEDAPLKRQSVLVDLSDDDRTMNETGDSVSTQKQRSQDQNICDDVQILSHSSGQRTRGSIPTGDAIRRSKRVEMAKEKGREAVLTWIGKKSRSRRGSSSQGRNPSIKMMCPICNFNFPQNENNDEVNKHIDLCLGYSP